MNKTIALFQARDNGLPLVSIAQFDQNSSFPLVAHADSGIDGPEDFAGKEVGIWFDGDELEFFALMSQAGLDPDSDMTVFEQGFTMESFLNREYDVAMTTSFDELNVLRLEGLTVPDDLTVIDPADYGISVPHGALIANEEWLQDAANADAAARFLRATLRGWRYAFDNQDETATVVAAAALAGGGEATRVNLEELQKLMLVSMEELHFPEGFDAARHGAISLELYQSGADIATQFGLVSAVPDVGASVVTSVWDEATGN